MSRGGRRPGAGARKIPANEKQRITSFTLSPKTLSQLNQIAAETGQSRSKLAERALREFLGDQYGY